MSDKVKEVKDIATGAWWMVILTGILGILFGLFAIFWPGLTISFLAYIFGIFIVIIGAAWLAIALTSINTNRLWWLSLLFALACIAAGVYLFFNPLITVSIFVIVAAIVVFIQSLVDLIHASYSDKKEDKWLWAIAGILGVIFGFVILFFPTGATLAFVWIFGLYCLIRGIAAIVYAIQVKGKFDKLYKKIK